MKATNFMKLEVSAQSVNESFVRGTVAAFAAQVDPTLDEINDLKTAVSEAITNSVVHAFDKTDSGNIINVECELFNTHIIVKVSDKGKGIKDINQAMQPFVTTRADEERSGMGFTVMQSFVDDLDVTSKPGQGTTIIMRKNFSGKSKESAFTPRGLNVI